MRAGGRVDDGPAPVHELELVVAPVGALGALVLAVAGCDRLLRQRRGRVGCVEEELDVLPVALVEVVPVVVDVEEPVLERQPPRVRGVGGDVGVDDRLGVVGDPVRPALVCAAGVERVAGEVEVVLVEAGQIVRRRADLDQVECVPRPPQRDRRLVEERVDVDRLVRLARAALLELLDEPDDGCVPLRECDLVVERGRRGRREGDEGRRDGHDERSDQDAGSDRKMSSPSRRERKRAASCPRTLFPAASSGGAYVPRPPLPGATVTMPPPIPLLPGSPIS